MEIPRNYRIWDTNTTLYILHPTPSLKPEIDITRRVFSYARADVSSLDRTRAHAEREEANGSDAVVPHTYK